MPEKNEKTSARPHRMPLMATMLVLLFVLTFSFRTAAENIVPSMTVQGTDLGKLSYEQAQEVLGHKFEEYLTEPIILSYKGYKKVTTLKRLGYDFDDVQTVSRVRSAALGNGVVDHFGFRLASVLHTPEVQPVFTSDEEKFKKEVLYQYPELGGAHDAQIIVNDNKYTEIVPQKDGLVPDFKVLKGQIDQLLNAGKEIETVQLKALSVPARYTSDQAAQDAELLKPYLTQKVHFTHVFSLEDRYNYYETVQIQPDWLTVKNGEPVFFQQNIADYLSENISPKLESPLSNAVITALPAEGEIYASVEGVAMDGIFMNEMAMAQKVIDSIRDGSLDVELELQTIEAHVTNATGTDLGDLVRLSEGKSGFAGSDPNRIFNIRKGLTDKINNILLAPGQEFSFTDNLGEVETSNGWRNAKAIFGGDELIDVPGGGLCQVSTTLYRAVLGAGMDVLEQSNHTLYVLYYEEYGNGLDAAIYPGYKDFRFKNNTDNYLLVQAYSDPQHGYVDFYGTPKHQSVEMLGPIYSGRVPEEYRDLVNPNWNEIAWIQKITDENGEVVLNPIISRYRTAPRKLYGLE